jgi:hypothetical protein
MRIQQQSPSIVVSCISVSASESGSNPRSDGKGRKKLEVILAGVWSGAWPNGSGRLLKVSGLKRRAEQGSIAKCFADVPKDQPVVDYWTAPISRSQALCSKALLRFVANKPICVEKRLFGI